MIELNSFILGDCIEGMRNISNESIDVIIADPPFFMPASHYQSRVSWGKCFADLSILGEYFFTLAREFKRILKQNGNIIVFCNGESYPVFYPILYGYFENNKCMIWDKTRIGLGKIFRHQHELMIWSFNVGAFINNDGKVHSDILSYPPTLSADRIHPVEKPISLYKEILSIVSKKNHVVLDPFVGSGTSLQAAIDLGIKYIGFEMEKKYYEAATKRIKNHTDQLRIV